MKISDHKVFGDTRGKLIAFESELDVPFNIRRIFYIFGTPRHTIRGEHSHYKTKQYLIALNGSCKVTLDNGDKKITHNLNDPKIGLFQDSLIWGTMHDFSSDCILLVLASEKYTSDDYIQDYNIFKSEVKNEFYS
jgi:hypothetical protein